MDDPVLVVETPSADDYQRQCANLVEQGYKLKAAACDPGDAKGDCSGMYQAIFVNPEIVV